MKKYILSNPISIIRQKNRKSEKQRQQIKNFRNSLRFVQITVNARMCKRQSEFNNVAENG